MNSPKQRKTKKGLLGHVRKQRLKYISILPSLITLINALSGFAAIICAANGDFVKSGFFVILAMIADMLDGRVARMSQSTSSFGGQLDSLCDMVSFGLAPAYLVTAFLKPKFELLGEMGHAEVFLQRFIWLAAATYLSCAAIRLARFNVENEEDESAHMSFVGLPSPAAAGVVISIVLFHQRMLTFLAGSETAVNILEIGSLIVLPVLTLWAGILMISRIRYPHVVNQYMRGRKPFGHLIRILLLGGLVVWSIQTAMLVVFCGFAAWGFFRWLINRALRKSPRPSTDNAEPPEKQ